MMLLRSSSTPILSSALTGKPGSLLRSTSSGENHLKLSFLADPSPVMLQSKRILRVNSDGNLNLSILPEEKEIEIENETESDPPVEFNEVDSPVKFLESLVTNPITKLQQIPSFSVYERDWLEEEKQKNMKEIDETGEEEEEEEDDDDDEEDEEEKEEFSFSCPQMNGGSANQEEDNEGFGFFQDPPTSLNMAIGLGLGMDRAMMTKRRTVDYEQLQQHYEKIIEDNPGNPLMLGNYARYLYKVKEDYRKAEEFYSRAILAEPNEGEVLSEYAKLRWEIHGDKERASNYFARSVQASPENCHVRAAYASFLWDTEESEDEQENTQHLQQLTYANAK
ncbi:myelin transcription factor 1-like protein [Macadamia integrifolia]|uniref:myelin transcription factor 1-like protein n=1 Tax=Macadamia integrifolia TaxID=60698 RepID=UPI001C4F826A|nr:myelin transcription factor 1-like protein [Macadamia integrifolia]